MRIGTSYDQLLGDPSLPVSKPTQSYWQNPGHEKLLGIQSDKLPSQCDIVIVGSGITACSVSRELLTNGFPGSITVLEAREVCSGATGRNGGRINCVAVQDYDKYRRQFGDAAAKRIVRFELAHFAEILAAAKSLGPELFEWSEVRTVETVATVFSEEKLQELKSMLANFNAAFPDLAGQWTVAEGQALKKYHVQDAKGALVGKAGAAWPYRLITSLYARLLQDYGVRFSLETWTPALGISRDTATASSYPYRINTPRGPLHAKHVVHCTEGHTSHLVPGLRGILVPRRGQMSVQNPGKAFSDADRTRSWSFYFRHGFDYLCQNPRTGEIFVGGGELGGFDGGLDIHGIASDAQENVLAKSHLAGILPVVFGLERWGEQQPGKPLLKASWVGILCNSLDRVPMVGLLPQEALGSRPAGDRQSGGEWISAGYGGYGMVNSWRSGKAVAQQLLGRETSSWLPPEYCITSERMVKLSTKLSEVAGSEKHLRALL